MVGAGCGQPAWTKLAGGLVAGCGQPAWTKLAGGLVAGCGQPAWTKLAGGLVAGCGRPAWTKLAGGLVAGCRQPAWTKLAGGERSLVRKERFELSRSCERQPLKLVRLPVPPLSRGRTVPWVGADRTAIVTAAALSRKGRRLRLLPRGGAHARDGDGRPDPWPASDRGGAGSRARRQHQQRLHRRFQRILQ